MSQKKFSGAPFGVQTSRCVPGFVRFCGASDLLTGIEPIAKLNCLYLKLVLNLFYVQVIFSICDGNLRPLVQRSKRFRSVSWFRHRE